MLSPRTPSNHAYIRTLNLMGWSLVIFLGLFSELSILDQLFFAEVLTGTAGTAIYGLLSSVCYMTPFILGGVMFYVFNKKNKTQPIRFQVKLPPVTPLLILAGLAIIQASAYVNSWICELIHYDIPPELIESSSYDNPSNIILYMTVALAPAFSEEFLFRGVIYGNLRPFGRAQAVLISAALFAAMHQNIAQFFYTFMAGIAMALMYELTESIWCGIIFHLLNNEMSILKEILYNGKLGDAVEPLMMLWDVAILVLGAVSIFILIRYYRGKAKASEESRAHGVFGEGEKVGVEAYDETIESGTLLRGLRTPGMMVFAVLVVVSVVRTYLTIVFLNLGAQI